MNKAFTLPAEYKQDLHGWARRQAALLRAGRAAEIDPDNIAEEIEGVAAAEYHRLVSALRACSSPCSNGTINLIDAADRGR